VNDIAKFNMPAPFRGAGKLLTAESAGKGAEIAEKDFEKLAQTALL
jgi:hypothetical protein